MNINIMNINSRITIHEDYRRSLLFSTHFLAFGGFPLCIKHILLLKLVKNTIKYYKKSNGFMHVTCVKDC